jgi:ribosomal protein S13
MPSRKRWLRLIVPGLLALTRILGMDPQEAKKICAAATAATKNKRIHSYYHQ